MRFLPDASILTGIAHKKSDRLLRAGRQALPGLIFGVLVVVVYADPVFVRRNFTGRDLPTYQLPIEKAVHDAWARGAVPVWVDEISGGRPLLPNPNSGALYPPRIAMALLPFPVAARVFPVLHWLIAGLGMLTLLRASGISTGASFVGAATYAFSGTGVSLVFYTPFLVGMALLPWVVITARNARSGRSAEVLLLSIVLGLDLLAGEIFTIGLAVAAAAAWLFAEAPRGERRRAFLALAGALGLALLIAAPQIVATSLWIPETRRGVTGMTVEEAIYFSISPARLAEFVVPFPFGRTWDPGLRSVWIQRVFHGKAMGLFATLYAGALAPIALLATRRTRTGGVVAARWFFLLTITAAVLPSLIPAGLYRLHAPVALRYPEKFSIGAAFALSFLAAASVDAFARELRPRVLIATGAVFAAIAVVAHVLPEKTGRMAASLLGARAGAGPLAAQMLPRALVEGALLWNLTVAAVLLVTSGAAGRMAGLTLLVAIPVLANRRIALTDVQEEVLSPTPFARFVARRDPAGRFRVLGESMYLPSSAIEAGALGSDVRLTDLARRHWYEYEGVLWHRGTVLNLDFDSGDLSRVHSLRELALVASRYRDSGRFFGGLALAWGIRFRDQPPLAGYRRVGGDALQDWDYQEDSRPDLRLVERWREAPGAVEALRQLPALAPGEVVVETGSTGTGMAPAGRLRILLRSPESLRLEVDAPGRTYLHLLRAFWGYRRVRLDGRPVEVLPSQLAFSAVAIPPGRHRVEWTEEVPGGSVSRSGPLLFVLAAGLLLVRRRR